MLWDTGHLKKGDLFSKDAMGDVIAEYMEDILNLSSSRWDKILGSSKPELAKPMKIVAAPSLRQRRRGLYVRSSPPAEED